MNTTLSASPTGSPSPTRSLPEPWIIRLKAVVPELICVAIILNRKLVPSTHFSRTIAPRGRPIAQMDGVFLATADASMNQQNRGMYQSANNNQDRKSTRLNSSHVAISYAVFCLKKQGQILTRTVHLKHQEEA